MIPHLLSCIIFTPLAGAALILFIPKSMTGAIKWTAVLATAAVGILTFIAYQHLNLKIRAFSFRTRRFGFPNST